jgi:deazaflavin-dependent oxidoreductase (nitroreductase family)
MANSAPGGASDYNTKIIEEFRANEGRVGGPLGIPLILIHHVGAKSGIERVTPAGLLPQPDGRFAIAASHGRSPAHPDWYYNLKAHPRITVEVGTQTFPVLAEELAGAARAALWPTLAAQAPSAGKIAGQDHAADSGVHADPPGLTWSATLRIGGFDSGHLTGSWGTWPGQATPACPACTTT